MVEIFELIMQYPAQFLAGLGLSSATIYAIFNGIKAFIGLCTKKSKKLKEIIQNNNIADAVISKLGGVETFIDNIADHVINKLVNAKTTQDIKTILEAIANKNDCPVELKAYIDTVLSQSGSENLQLLYEQTKAHLLNIAKVETKAIITNGTEALEQEKQEDATVSKMETVEMEQQPQTTPNETPKEDDDIEYV